MPPLIAYSVEPDVHDVGAAAVSAHVSPGDVLKHLHHQVGSADFIKRFTVLIDWVVGAVAETFVYRVGDPAGFRRQPRGWRWSLFKFLSLWPA
jgi:hypothetical protein